MDRTWSKKETIDKIHYSWFLDFCSWPSLSLSWSCLEEQTQIRAQMARTMWAWVTIQRMIFSTSQAPSSTPTLSPWKNLATCRTTPGFLRSSKYSFDRICVCKEIMRLDNNFPFLLIIYLTYRYKEMEEASNFLLVRFNQIKRIQVVIEHTTPIKGRLLGSFWALDPWLIRSCSSRITCLVNIHN